MPNRIHAFRSRLEAYLRAEGRSLSREAAGEAPVELAEELATRFADLRSAEARDAARSLRDSFGGELEGRAACDHLERFERLRVQAKLRSLLDPWRRARTGEGTRADWLREAVERPQDATPLRRMEGEAQGVVQELSTRLRDLAAGDPEVAARASAWLDSTDDVFSAAHEHVVRGEAGLNGLLPALDSPFGPRGAARRAAERFSALPLSSVMRRVRVVAAPCGAAGRLAAPEPPLRVELAVPALPLGLGAELAVAEVVGQSLAQAAVSPALPPALRWVGAAGVGRALGWLSMQLVASPPTIDRFASGGGRERLGRRVGALLLACSRWLAAGAVWHAGPRDARSAAEGLERALGVECSPALALELLPIMDGPSRFVAAVDGLALWDALRERFDVDWYRNPRSDDALRAACERGGAFSGAAWLADLGGAAERAEARAAELFPC